MRIPREREIRSKKKKKNKNKRENVIEVNNQVEKKVENVSLDVQGDVERSRRRSILDWSSCEQTEIVQKELERTVEMI